MPGLTASAIETNAVIVGVCLVAIVAGIGLAPLTAAVVGLVRRRRAATRPMPEIGDEIDQAIENVSGAAGPSDAEITRMVRDYKNRNGR